MKIPSSKLNRLNIAELEAEIHRHMYLYWDQNQPEISDYEYDRLVERLRELAPDSPLLIKMGPSESPSIGAEVHHKAPMLSLDKCYAFEESHFNKRDLLSWAHIIDRGKNLGPRFTGDVMVTPKMDGIAASLRYNQSGDLVLVATRGDGWVGEDITANARTIVDIVKHGAEANSEVRGEIYMKLSVFAPYSKTFANPRNLAAGAIKHKDPQRCKAYGLSFAAYDLLDTSCKTEEEKFLRLQDSGFPPLEHLLVDIGHLQKGVEHFSKRRTDLDFEIDGVVFKVNQVDEQERLGMTAHHPRYSIAYKFQGDSATTILKKVQWSVSRSGVITPVALLKPVQLSGATISRASLHHAGFLEKMGLLGKSVGALVVVTRRGGVIPKVEFVHQFIESTANECQQTIDLPERCPSCNRSPVRRADFLYCSYPDDCPAVIIGGIRHYCAALDIQGFGEKILRQAFERGLLRTPIDLYHLNIEELLTLERVGRKLAENLIEEVERHRQVAVSSFLRALGIEELGSHVAQLLEDRYLTLEQIRRLRVDDLASVVTIGPVIAEKVIQGLKSKRALIDGLLEHLTLIQDRGGGVSNPSGSLAGLSFVFTGKLIALDRKLAQKMVVEKGGEAPSSVTKTLSYLVVGDGSEEKKSSKQIKAERYIAEGGETHIIKEWEFLRMIRAPN